MSQEKERTSQQFPYRSVYRRGHLFLAFNAQTFTLVLKWHINIWNTSTHHPLTDPFAHCPSFKPSQHTFPFPKSLIVCKSHHQHGSSCLSTDVDRLYFIGQQLSGRAGWKGWTQRIQGRKEWQKELRRHAVKQGSGPFFTDNPFKFYVSNTDSKRHVSHTVHMLLLEVLWDWLCWLCM